MRLPAGVIATPATCPKTVSAGMRNASSVGTAR